MIGTRKVCCALVAVCFLAQIVAAQEVALPRTRNAALRYWMAFALLQDPPADKSTQALLENVAEGRVPWDELRLGPLIDQNSEAILTMQRATQLPECNWGLEYDLGAETPLAHLAKARVMARLNVLYGMRLAAKHDSAGAVDAWLAGLRFARHIAQSGSLIGAHTAKVAMLADLNALTRALENGSLDSASVLRVKGTVQALPEYGFDWSESIRFEFLAEEMAIKQLAKSPDPKLVYKQWFGEEPPAPFVVPDASVVSQWRNLRDQAVAAFRRPSPEMRDRLAKIQRDIGSLNPTLRQITPSLTHVEEARGQIGMARQNLLHAVEAHLRH